MKGKIVLTFLIIFLMVSVFYLGVTYQEIKAGEKNEEAAETKGNEISIIESLGSLKAQGYSPSHMHSIVMEGELYTLNFLRREKRGEGPRFMLVLSKKEEDVELIISKVTLTQEPDDINTYQEKDHSIAALQLGYEYYFYLIDGDGQFIDEMNATGGYDLQKSYEVNGFQYSGPIKGDVHIVTRKNGSLENIIKE